MIQHLTDIDNDLRDTDPLLWGALLGCDLIEVLPIGAMDSPTTAYMVWSYARKMAKVIRRYYPDEGVPEVIENYSEGD